MDPYLMTLRQPDSTGGTVTYEARFETLSLGGSLFRVENDQSGRMGGLNVSLSGPDGRVLGGGVAGLLIAASPVQVVLASFVSDSEAIQVCKENGKCICPTKGFHSRPKQLTIKGHSQ
ncbi:AT-hook motif nuclear-localized protein 7-like [Cajanus cajan]|uniref:AT-hook motif nuclear-localized protein 7-like n=1 Tax=Cajanus cajan TaxID=3821 RepID=UPI00098D9F7E|nr:AT-hook motif nuclear-localized protein 7-like [Cajanus cajan]